MIAVRPRPRVEIVAVAVAVVPVVVALVRSVATHRLPIGDNAYVEMRARDVFTTEHFPLLGTASSVSLSAGRDVNHPGPLLFDLLALPVKLFGGPVGVALGVAVINALAIVGTAVVARRVAGPTACVLAALVASVLAWAMGSELLVDPWNPHVLMLPALLLLTLCWGVANGDLALVPWAMLVGTLVLQVHLGYALVVPTAVVAGLVGAVLVHRRRWHIAPAIRGADVARMRRIVAVSAAVLVVAWAQPLWEQLFGRGDGNMVALLTSADDDGPRIGLPLGVRIVGRVVALPPWWGRKDFVDAVPYTPYDADGVSLSPSGMPGTLPAVVVLLAVVALLAWAAVAAVRRRDRPVATATAFAVALLAIAVMSLTVMPVGVLGLTVHQMRWVWSVGAFVTFAALLAVARPVELAQPRWTDALRRGGTGVTALVVALNLPAHVQLTGNASLTYAQDTARELSRQFDAYRPAEPVLFDTSGLRFAEPYSTVVLSALQRNGIEFVVAEQGMVRQLGEARRADGRERTRLYQLEGRAALNVPEGASRVALATPLTEAEIAELLALEAEVVAALSTGQVGLSADGVARVRGGRVPGVPPDSVAHLAADASRLVRDGVVAELTRAGALELDAAELSLFTRAADLRAEVGLTTVAIFAEPIAFGR